MNPKQESKNEHRHASFWIFLQLFIIAKSMLILTFNLVIADVFQLIGCESSPTAVTLISVLIEGII